MKIQVKAITDDKEITHLIIVLNKKERELCSQYKMSNIESKRKFLEITAKNFLKLGFTKKSENQILNGYLTKTIEICSGFLNVE